MDSSQRELVIFDVETIIETEAIVEFGAIIICPRTLVEKECFSSPVRPRQDWLFGDFEERSNGLNRKDIISSNIFFSDIAHNVYDMLDGRTWVGHNIINFDWRIVELEFREIGRSPPEPSGIIDTMKLCEHFRGEAGNVQMATLAKYFDLGEQTHRSLADVRLNLRLFRRCAAVFFLTESKLLRAQYGNTDSNRVPRFLEPEEYTIPSLGAIYDSCDSFDQVRDVNLRISCAALNVKLGPKYWDNYGHPNVSFVVYAPDNLSTMLDDCDRMLQRLFHRFGINSEWKNLVARAWNPPSVTLSIANTADKHTIVCKRTDSGETRRLVFGESPLETLLPPGTKLDAYFSLETYDYRGSTRIRLVAHKLIIHP